MKSLGICAYIRLLFAYNIRVWNLPESRIFDYIVQCKNCGENIPAPVETMPDTWIVAECPLCRERRSYLPARNLQRASIAPSALKEASEIRIEVSLKWARCGERLHVRKKADGSKIVSRPRW